MRIPEQDIQNIRQKADIVEIIGRSLPLEKKGKDYVTVCPFHDDHDPSMRVSPDRQIYKCFVCGAGGNVFTFLQKYEGLSFVQSVKKVADLVGYPLHVDEAPVHVDPRENLYDTLDLFTSYCTYELYSRDGEKALAYLQERKFEKKMLEDFQIGYAPLRSMVADYLQARIPDRSLLEQTGLIHIGREKLSPVFFERIVIPIHDAYGHPAGYTARVLPDGAQSAKYINTPTSALYDKSSLIFNFHRASKAARKAKRLILCEGAMDVLGLAKAGLLEGIASLGTAMTDQQLRLIESVHVPVTVFYDQDAAGQKAAWNFGLKAMSAGIPFSIVRQNDAKDPDEIYIHSGKEALQKAVSSTVSFAEFAFDYLQSVYDLGNYEDKKSYARQMEQLIRKTLEPFEQPACFERLKSLTGFSFEGPAFQTGKQKRQPRVQHAALPDVPHGRKQAEKAVLWAMLYQDDFVEKFRQDDCFLTDPLCEKLSLYILHAYRNNREVDPSGLYEAIEEDDVRDLLAELAEWPDYSAVLPRYYEDSVRKIKLDVLSDQIEQLKRQIAGCSDPAEKISLISRKQKLVEQRLSLQTRKEK